MNDSNANLSLNKKGNIIFQLLQTMHLPVAVICPQYNEMGEIIDFELVFINKSAADSFNISIDNLQGKKLLELFPENIKNGVFEGLRSVFLTDNPQTIQSGGFDQEVNNSFRTNIKLAAIKFDNYIIINWIDNTFIQNQAKTIKILKNSNEELEQFAYIASHDLQEPIRMVISFTQLLQRRYADKLDEDAREFIRFAVDGAERMKELIDNLLVYSRVNTSVGKWEDVPVKLILDKITEDFQIMIAESGIKICYGDSLPVIYTDKSMFRRLLANLLSNSIKYSNSKNPEVKIDVSRNNSEWIFSITDNGIGIEEKYYEKIFMIFQRLHNKKDYPGTGIGLAICKRIVEKLGGNIWVESQPDKGTTFYFTIPLKEH